MTLITSAYCTEAQLIRFLSQTGLDDFGDNDADGTADTDVVNDCLFQATDEINLYAMQRYTAAQLGTSTVIERWCVVMAARFLCQRRGNPVPESIEAEWERIASPNVGLLVQISKGTLQLGGIALRDNMRPTMSNLTVDRRYRRSQIRVTKTNSSNPPTKLSQDSVIERPGRFE